eukprot:6069839-Prymnesium_polylepis.1
MQLMSPRSCSLWGLMWRRDTCAHDARRPDLRLRRGAYATAYACVARSVRWLAPGRCHIFACGARRLAGAGQKSAQVAATAASRLIGHSVHAWSYLYA